MPLIQIDRKSQLSVQEFQENYLKQNIPVIVTDAMHDWNAKTMWTPDYFINYYGNEEVQVYDDLFNLTNIVSLKDYIGQFFGRDNTISQNRHAVPYVRWYTRLKNYDFPWADHIFKKIKPYWQMPYFLPDKDYLLPYSYGPEKIDPNENMFPAKGIFISAKGARTKLHYDPWCSDAILCQMYGSKKVTLYHPSQKKFLCTNNECADIENPDYKKFANFSQAEPAFIDILAPGEIIFFPHNWLHHVSTIEDSISITWNFVHMSTWISFFNYLTDNPKTQELEVIKFFLSNTHI